MNIPAALQEYLYSITGRSPEQAEARKDILLFVDIQNHFKGVIAWKEP